MAPHQSAILIWYMTLKPPSAVENASGQSTDMRGRTNERKHTTGLHPWPPPLHIHRYGFFIHPGSHMPESHATMCSGDSHQHMSHNFAGRVSALTLQASFSVHSGGEREAAGQHAETTELATMRSPAWSALKSA